MYTYDAFGRIVQQQHIRPAVTDTYTTTYDAQGRVTQETTPTGFINYEYDLLGRKTKTQSGIGFQPVVLSEITYTYDLLGRLSTVNTVKRDGAIVDSNGAGAGTPPEATTYFYDLLGRPDYTIMPNSVVEDYTFDNMNRIDIQRHYALDNGNVNMTTPFLRTEFDYTYRADGQKTGLTEKEVLGGQTRTSTTSWSYDNASRLTSETLDHWDNNADSAPADLRQTESYVLDLFGNRVSRTVDKPSTAYVDSAAADLRQENTGGGTRSRHRRVW